MFIHIPLTVHTLHSSKTNFYISISPLSNYLSLHLLLHSFELWHKPQAFQHFSKNISRDSPRPPSTPIEWHQLTISLSFLSWSLRRDFGNPWSHTLHLFWPPCLALKHISLSSSANNDVIQTSPLRYPVQLNYTPRLLCAKIRTSFKYEPSKVLWWLCFNFNIRKATGLSFPRSSQYIHSLSKTFGERPVPYWANMKFHSSQMLFQRGRLNASTDIKLQISIHI